MTLIAIAPSLKVLKKTLEYLRKQILENPNIVAWTKNFTTRLWVGRNVQKLFGSAFVSELGVGLLSHIKPIARQLMRHTYGKAF